MCTDRLNMIFFFSNMQSGYAYVVVWVGGLEVWEIRGFSKIMNKYFKSSFGMFLMEKRDPH